MEYIPRLKKKYQEEVVNSLKGNYKSVMEVPKLVKICLNQGIGSALSDKKQIEAAQNEMTMIAGQKAVLTKSTKDISNFKLRKGMPVGVRVTLRGDQMYEFLDRFVTSTLPRVRDFSGISPTGFDGRGNYTMGIKEQIAFPEISIDKINKITGMDITFVTNTDSDQEALLLLKELGMPFKMNDGIVREKKEKKKERKEIEAQEKLEVSSESLNDEVLDEIDETGTNEDVVEKNNTVTENKENNQDLSANTDQSES
tara:strand:+ start:5890 stop:6654 length:765 start_codon:yes stop_codon:yes gene_type:complete